MGNKVTITDLNGLSDYATSIREFVHQYEEQIASVRRTFDTQVTGSEADAISAFYDKLNDLQQRVFDQFPAALRSYEEVVSTYHNSVSGLGFSRLVKSQVEDAENVAQLLSKNQLEAIKTITAALQGAFNDAATAMGTTPESVSSINTLSEQVLTDAANSRKTLGSDLDEAYRVFVAGLTEQTEAIKSLNISISNVAYVITIPPATVIRAIKSGALTAYEVNEYFDKVTSKADAQALQAIIGDSPGDVMKIKPDTISNEMYSVIAEEINQWTLMKNVEKLNNLAEAMNVNDVTQNDIFTKKLLIVEDLKGIKLLDQMYTLYQSKPVLYPGATVEEIKDYHERMERYQLELAGYKIQLDSLNMGSGFIQSLQTLRVGTSVEKGAQSRGYQLHTYTNMSVKVSIDVNRAIVFETTQSLYNTYLDDLKELPKYGNSTAVETYKSYLSTGNVGAASGEMSERLAELQREREDAVTKLISGNVESVLKGIVSLNPYGAIAITGVEALSYLTDDNIPDGVEKGKETLEEAYGKYKESFKERTGMDFEEAISTRFREQTGVGVSDKSITATGNVLSNGANSAIEIYRNYQNYDEMIKRIAQSENKAIEVFRDALLNKGGWTLDAIGYGGFDHGSDEWIYNTQKPLETAASRHHYYDFETFLRLQEFDQHGLSGFVGSDKEINNHLNKIVANHPKMTAELAAYIRGQTTYQDPQTGREQDVSLRLTTLSAEQFEVFSEIIRDLKYDGFEELNKYLDRQFGD